MQQQPALEVRRIIAQSRSQVFTAWVKAERLKLWFGPGRLVAVEAFVDLYLDGGFRFVVEGPGGASGQRTRMTFYGGFREIKRDTKLVMDWVVAGDPGDPNLLTVEFFDVPGGTEVLVRQQGNLSPEKMERDRIGWQQMLAKLDGIFKV